MTTTTVTDTWTLEWMERAPATPAPADNLGGDSPDTAAPFVNRKTVIGKAAQAAADQPETQTRRSQSQKKRRRRAR